MAINGMDCMCEAQHKGECVCGCDWTTPKEARLETRNADLLAVCRMARQYPAAITTELALDAAIARAKGRR